MDRGDELASRLAHVRKRISAATVTAGRTEEPQLIVVTKFFPATDVELLAGLGVRDVGENRSQEAAAKAARVPGLRWHFIGQLQSNKARSVVRYASAVHSVDRASLATALDKAMTAEQDRRDGESLEPREPLQCFLQIDLGAAGSATARSTSGDMRSKNAGAPAEPGSRGGVSVAGLAEVSDAVLGTRWLRLAGIMAVAPLDADPAEAFGRLQDISVSLTRVVPEACSISAGMSADLEYAVAAGATHLRIGSDVLGARPPVR